MNRLRQDGEVEKEISPNFIVRNWPPAFVEWSTKSSRDTFFASPLFPRLLNPESIKETIARGVESGIFAYVGKTKDNKYAPFCYEETMLGTDIEISEDMYIIQKAVAEEYRKSQTIPIIYPTPTVPEGVTTAIKETQGEIFKKESGKEKFFSVLRWSGEVVPQKWMNFYTKVLSRFVSGSGLKLKIEIEVKPEGGVPQQKVEQTKIALRELGLDENIDFEK